MADSTRRPLTLLRALAAFALAVAPAGAFAQDPLMVVAIPALATPNNVDTEAGKTGVIGIQIAQLIASDLRQSGAAVPAGPENLRPYSPTEAGAPQYEKWADLNARALVTGYVQARDDGRLTVVCYLYNTRTRREMTRTGFAVAPTEWRRAGHRCADAIYAELTDSSGYFDSSIAYVAETGSRTAPVKRLAIMHFDGTDHRYLTEGAVTVLGPRFAPDGERLAYVSFRDGQPHVRLIDIASGEDRPLVQSPGMSFAPAFSPDGRQVAFSMASGGNTDIYVVDTFGGFPQRLTSAPGTDTSPSFSPDGRRIVFESDRSGNQQLYVMSADGSGQRRISFGPGAAYASPAWSPDGERIAFTRIAGGSMRIGVMTPEGRDERAVTDGWQDEGPSWAPNSRLITFFRTTQGTGRALLHVIPLNGGEARRLPAPQDGSDPSWSPPRQ